MSNTEVSNLRKYFSSMLAALIVLIHVSVAVSQDPNLENVYDSMSPEIGQSDYSIHDPSRVVSRKDYQMIAVTGKAQEDGYNCGLETWYRSLGFSQWLPGQCLLAKKPKWIREEIKKQDGAYWAPELINLRSLYYSAADYSGKSGITCVGLARATGSFPKNMTWKDSGKPVTCVNQDEWDFEVSAIDPSFLRTPNGKMYLITGGGLIHGTEVDPGTFLPKSDDWFSPDAKAWKHLARGPTSEIGHDWVEAPYAYYRGGWYYLFVNWGACCRGKKSTYNIRVGRSRNPLGPYKDKTGCNMIDGCGSLLLKSRSFMRGPGHSGIWKEKDGKFVFSFHYYDVRRDGVSWTSERRLRWVNGWPKVGRVLNYYDLE